MRLASSVVSLVNKSVIDTLAAVLFALKVRVRQSALAVRVGAPGAAHSPVRQLHHPPGRREGEARPRLAAHAPTLVRVLPRRQGHRLTNDAGLPRASRSQAYGSLHPCRPAPV